MSQQNRSAKIFVSRSNNRHLTPPASSDPRRQMNPGQKKNYGGGNYRGHAPTGNAFPRHETSPSANRRVQFQPNGPNSNDLIGDTGSRGIDVSRPRSHLPYSHAPVDQMQSGMQHPNQRHSFAPGPCAQHRQKQNTAEYDSHNLDPYAAPLSPRQKNIPKHTSPTSNNFNHHLSHQSAQLQADDNCSIASSHYNRRQYAGHYATGTGAIANDLQHFGDSIGTSSKTRQRLMDELIEAKRFMNDSVTMDGALFWRKHVMELRTRLRETEIISDDQSVCAGGCSVSGEGRTGGSSMYRSFRSIHQPQDPNHAHGFKERLYDDYPLNEEEGAYINGQINADVEFEERQASDYADPHQEMIPTMSPTHGARPSRIKQYHTGQVEDIEQKRPIVGPSGTSSRDLAYHEAAQRMIEAMKGLPGNTSRTNAAVYTFEDKHLLGNPQKIRSSSIESPGESRNIPDHYTFEKIKHNNIGSPGGNTKSSTSKSWLFNSWNCCLAGGGIGEGGGTGSGTGEGCAVPFIHTMPSN